MKKKYIIFSIVTLVLLVSFLSYSKYLKITNVCKEGDVKPTKITKGISMNFEQTAGAGDYKTVTQSSWPTKGYKFNAELSRCEKGSGLSWDDTKKAVIVSGNVSDKCYVYFDIYVQRRFDETCNSSTLACHIAKQYTGTQGENSLYYHDSTLANGAGDNSYRYAGASNNVNNYICLGSDATTCPDANLFRIIGVFGDQTKVIRAKSVGDKAWHSSTSSNTWSTSSLNTYLNGEYLTSLGTLADKIATTTWKVGGGSTTYLYDVPKTAYQYEVGSSASSTTVDKKIGLMYVTDYYYSASPSAWTLVGYNGSDATKDYRAAKTINWLYLGSTEWTISRTSDSTTYAFRVNSTGYVNCSTVTNSFAARPSFNLESSVKYVSGSGSMSDPVRVN